VEETQKLEAFPDSFDDITDVRPELGDIVNHKQFGKCTVSRIDDDHITLKKPNGRHVPLGLQILVFKKVGDAEGKRVFDVDVQVGMRR
jgi:hypothetical protein